jgi:hypothetical protein
MRLTRCYGYYLSGIPVPWQYHAVRRPGSDVKPSSSHFFVGFLQSSIETLFLVGLLQT